MLTREFTVLTLVGAPGVVPNLKGALFMPTVGWLLLGGAGGGLLVVASPMGMRGLLKKMEGS